MYELPASIRLSLWLTLALRHHVPFESALRSSLPDVDAVDGALERLEVWRDFGERVVCADLPRPGLHGGLLPATSAANLAAMDAGECIFVPSLGGALVPRLEYYGPTSDEGLRLTLEPHDSDPVPAHRLEMLALPDIDRRFREAIATHVGALEALDITPLNAGAARESADTRMASAQWALPEGISGRAIRILTTAGSIAAALDQAMDAPVTAAVGAAENRWRAIRGLLNEAELAMAGAATVAAMELAGLR